MLSLVLFIFNCTLAQYDLPGKVMGTLRYMLASYTWALTVGLAVANMAFIILLVVNKTVYLLHYTVLMILCATSTLLCSLACAFYPERYNDFKWTHYRVATVAPSWVYVVVLLALLLHIVLGSAPVNAGNLLTTGTMVPTAESNQAVKPEVVPMGELDPRPLKSCIKKVQVINPEVLSWTSWWHLQTDRVLSFLGYRKPPSISTAPQSAAGSSIKLVAVDLDTVRTWSDWLWSWFGYGRTTTKVAEPVVAVEPVQNINLNALDDLPIQGTNHHVLVLSCKGPYYLVECKKVQIILPMYEDRAQIKFSSRFFGDDRESYTDFMEWHNKTPQQAVMNMEGWSESQLNQLRKIYRYYLVLAIRKPEAFAAVLVWLEETNPDYWLTQLLQQGKANLVKYPRQPHVLDVAALKLLDL